MRLPATDAVVGDVRFAFRYFARHKATIAIIVAVLALGSGANTLIFSLFQGQFLRPPPMVPDDPAHARVWLQERANPTARWDLTALTGTQLEQLGARREVFASVAAWVDEYVIIGAADSVGAQNTPVHFVTPNFFTTVGVPITHGRGLQLADPNPAVADLTGVIAAIAAERMFGSPEDAVGKQLKVNDVPVRVVGVAPRRFQGAERDDDEPLLWMPLSARSAITGARAGWIADDEVLQVIGRLAPGATFEQATAVAQQVAIATLPDSADRIGMARMADVQRMGALPPGEAGSEMKLVFALMALVGMLILLIGWMNVSSLMVAAAVARRQEIAVRLALGASRLRLIRQLITESTIVSTLGATAGGLAAYWVLRALTRSGLDGIDLAPDFGTFAFVAGLAVATGVLFGLSPALHATRGVAGALRDSGGGASVRSRLQRGLVVAQIALSQPLLVLLAMTLITVARDHQPIAPETGRTLIEASFRPLSDTTKALGPRQVAALIPRLESRAEVLAVVPAASVIGTRSVYASTRGREGRGAAGDSVRTILQLEAAAPGWFGALDVPILLGRDIAWSDTTSTDRPIVIGADLARALWGDANPVGRVIHSPSLDDARQGPIAMSVVGVYDSRVKVPGATLAGARSRSSDPYRIYTAYGRQWRHDRLLIRTRGPAAPHLADLQRFAIVEAPSLPIARFSTLQQIDELERKVTVQVSMLVWFGGAIALGLASLGLYGVVSLAVRQRTREIGIRIAIGAAPMQVARMFLGSGVKASVIALLIGLPVTIVGLRILISQGEMMVTAMDAYVSGVAIAVMLIAVAATATWIPARRAAQVDPGTTLRAE